MLRRTFANRWLNLAVLWELLLLGLIIYVPFLQGVFGIAGVRPSDWLLIACPSVTLWVVLESAKWVLRRGWLGEVDVACRLDAGRARVQAIHIPGLFKGPAAREQ
jgi:Ca2+-transporting ATPase